MAKKTALQTVTSWNAYVNDWASFHLLAETVPCIKAKVTALYKQGYSTDLKPVTPSRMKGLAGKLITKGLTKYHEIQLDNRLDNLKNFNSDIPNSLRAASQWVWDKYGKDWVVANITVPCAAKKQAADDSNNSNTNSGTDTLSRPDETLIRPFDRRLDRLEVAISGDSEKDKLYLEKRYVPFSSDFAELSTTGYLISQNTLNQKIAGATGDAQKALNSAKEKVQADYKEMANNEFYKGVPALQNYYALIRLFGSNGGKYLVNQKSQRRWYELDSTASSSYNFTSTPTTSALISWGQGDPYGRTPYQFTDFVFSKYWNKIQNNRLITLRRYAAPILDNLKFPGMISPTNTANSTAPSDIEMDDLGSIKAESIPFPPMATAITYFGAETGNSLNSILKFTTGVPWDDVQAAIWEVNTDTVASNESGPGKVFGGIAKFAEMLNVAGGKFDRALVMNDGMMPPDPYENGPYENRIKGPLNRIDSVKKRVPGMTFQWDGLNLVFEYVARPVGGINPKAVLLDIMSNFLVMGSASAVFFGGAHRFMANPAKYPFLGGQDGIERWYKGDPIGWSLTTIKQFTQGGAEPKGGGSAESAATGLFKSMEGFFNQLFSGEKGNIFGAITSLFTGATGNIINNFIAKKSAGQVPYLQGMKAILTGEPVGEWHVTIGNPLNPIAMIGNLICDGIDVEFNEELGPDDFPTEMKITVHLKHAMNRDRDAIESIFNRGMGRIYNLPDSFSGSADFQTVVDPATKKPTKVGLVPDGRMGVLRTEAQTGRYVSPKELQGRPSALGGEISIWNRASFSIGISENSAQQFVPTKDDIFLSAFRSADWIAQRSLT